MGVQINEITCPVCLQREEDMADLMKHIMFMHDSEEFGHICQECMDEAPWDSTQKRFSMGKYQMKKYPKKETKQKSLKVLLMTIPPPGLLWATQTKKARRTRKLTAPTRELWQLMMTRRKLKRKARSQRVRMHQRSQG